MITGLQDGSGVQHEDLIHITSIMQEHFADIFTLSNPPKPDMQNVLSIISNKVTLKMNESLTFMVEDIRHALFDLHLSKESAMDGMSTMFF